MSEPVVVVVSPTSSGRYVSFDSEGAAKIVFETDATQVAAAMRLMSFERGTLLRLTVEVDGSA